MVNLDFLKDKRFEPGLTEWAATSNSVLIDVRMPKEFENGHIPGAINIPLRNIKNIEDLVPDKETKLFVYCLTGSRSEHALIGLANLGYRNAKNIGGMNGYSGKLEKPQP